MQTITGLTNELFVDPKVISPRAGRGASLKVAGVSVEQILPVDNNLYGTYPLAYPAILTGRVSEDEWKEIVHKINNLWNPIVEENKRLYSGSLLAYTILAIPVHLAKEHKFRQQEKNIMKQITAYLDELNIKLNDKNIAILFRKEDAHNDVPAAFFIEIRRE